MVIEIPTYQCFLCGARFRVDDEHCEAKYVPKWKVTVCTPCLSVSREGILASSEVLAKLDAAHIKPVFTKTGLIAWPGLSSDAT
jgi:hypothetical protein